MTGLDEAGEADHQLLRRASGSEQSDEEIAPYRYGRPASPHLAAATAGEEIEPEALRAAADAAAADADALVCEGVGGLLVPLVRGVGSVGRRGPGSPYLVRDLAVDLGYPLVVVAPPGLGTINHTLLTIEAARGAGLEIACVVLTPWPEHPSAIEESNRDDDRHPERDRGPHPPPPRPRRPQRLAPPPPVDGPISRYIGGF